jgi:hypothetical protein
MTANKPMTTEQLDELMTVAVNMQRDSEKAGERPAAAFAYAVQVAVLELRHVRELKSADENHVAAMNSITAIIAILGLSDTLGISEQVAELKAQRDALAAENAGLNAFIDSLLSIAWQGGSADGADIQELALKHSLLRQEVYSADVHENLVDDPGNFEDGDPVYFRVETTAHQTFLAEVRAQGVDMMVEQCESDIMLIEPEDEEHYTLMIEHAKEFADQLHKGVQS